MGIAQHVRDNWTVFMSAKGAFGILLVLGLGGGFAGARILDSAEIGAANADRDLARDCRTAQSTASNCPVVYKDTKFITKTVTITKPVPDPAQAEEISRLQKDLADEKAKDFLRPSAAPNAWPGGGALIGVGPAASYSGTITNSCNPGGGILDVQGKANANLDHDLANTNCLPVIPPLASAP